MASIYKEIRSDLETHLSGTTGVPAIAWTNVDYDPVIGTPFIKPQFQPTSREAAVKGNDPQRLYQGLFTLLLHYPENQGPGASQDFADTLVERFDDTVVINSRVRIEYCMTESPYNSPPWFVTPVRVAWFVYD